MSEPFGDARLEELKLLTQMDRSGGVIRITPGEGPLRDVIAFVVRERFVNDLHIENWRYQAEGFPGRRGESLLERALNYTSVDTLSRVLAGEEVSLRLSHMGRLRLAELKQAMRASRDREPFNILWDGRHLENDLRISILEASKDAPLSIGFLDMNDLKGINDQLGHPAGDLALQAYFQGVAAALGDKGEAYRIGGDEVLAILPSQDSQQATRTLETACRLVMSERLKFPDGAFLPQLSISVGIATTTDPETKFDEFKKSADVAMYRAKKKTQGRDPRPSSIAVATMQKVLMTEANDTSPRKRKRRKAHR